MTKHRYFIPVIVLLLLIFSLISSAHLSQPLRAKQAQQAHWQSLQALLPSSMQHKALSFEQRQLSDDKAISTYYAVKQHDIITAWIIPVRMQGFADTIESWVVIDTQGAVQNVHIAQHKESASLIKSHFDSNSAWLRTLTGLSLQQANAIDHISQATISSRAVVQSVQHALYTLSQQHNTFNLKDANE